METGKDRASLVDIEQLTSVFEANTSAVKNADGVPVIPGSELPAIMAELSSRYEVTLMSTDGVEALKEFFVKNPDIPVTPQHLLSLVPAPTASNSADPPPPPPKDDPRSDSSGASSPDVDHLKGRGEIATPHRRPPRMSSSMSLKSNTSGRTAPPSPFDSQMRQRSVPLSNQAPSAWTRKPLPASKRRKSDAGSASGNRSSSDNESSPAIVRSSRRKSNPVSPQMSSSTSLPFPPSSYNSSALSPDSSFSSARRSQSFDHSLSQTLVDSFPTHTRKSKTSPNNPALQFSSESDTEPEDAEDDDESTHHYVRQALSSDASLQPEDLVEALQRTNAELSRKAAESERRMQNRLAERETEIADLEAQLDDLKTELSTSRREEKELRVKERGNMSQLATFESEIQKLQKSLEHHKTQYSNMQKQYQEQCTESERMRNVLRRKEQEIKDADDRAFMHEAETQKWAREREALEKSIETLEVELIATRHAANELDEQKQENLLLKETIDRLRFDLDALRAGMTSNVGGQNQGQGTLSRSLANEIKEGFERREREEREREKEEEEADSEFIVEDGSGSEDGYIETTITTTRKRTGKKPVTRLQEGTLREYADAETQHDPSEFVTSSSTQHDASWVASSMGVQHDATAFTATLGVQYDSELCTSSEGVQCDRGMSSSSVEVQYDSLMFSSSEGVQHQETEFSTQAGVQHDEAEFVSAAGVQHDVAIGSAGAEVQTEERVVKTVEVETAPDVRHAEVGTEVEVKHIETETEPEEPRPERTMCEVQTQTDEDVKLSAPSPVPTDLPPPYAQNPRETEAGVLKKWHTCLAERASTPGASSSQAREEWAALKRSVGVDCGVIDRIVEGKDVLGLIEDEGEEVTEWVRVPVRGSRRGLFNVYNTYIVRRDGWWTSILTQAVVGIGFWAVVAGIWGPRLAPFEVPTYTDRATWSAYNNYAGAFGEGLVGRSVDNPVWVAIERLVVGAAVRVGPGLPT
ncbi:unnamed protein product [Rhizoctonia solani]|uniref:Uncharacterized protein n=1 Tax=Rhizoctonia solani TaxID=456999 RepID=A0A8H3GVL5_9AGAM|nr:unnamed protein product [Rhizoctonia solani]